MVRMSQDHRPRVEPAAAPVDLSILLVNWNRADLTAACLDSIAANAPSGVRYEIILVDNGSEPDDLRSLQRPAHADGLCLIANASNQGFARAANQAMRAATGRYLLLLNNDTQVVGQALAALVQYMGEHADVGIAGARLVGADGRLRFSHDLFPQTPWRLAAERVVDRVAPANRWTRRARLRAWGDDPPSPINVDWVPGAAMLVRRQVLEEVGPLDEGYFIFAEDIDWCYRAKQAGWRIAYVPQATFVHLGGASSCERADVARNVARQRDRSLVRFYRRHHGLLAAAGMSLILRLKRRPGDRERPDTTSTGHMAGQARPTLAMVSTDIRRDLVAPLRCLTRLRLVHLYQRVPYGDLTGEDMDETLAPYGSPLDLFRRLWRARPDIVQGVEPFSLYHLPYQAAVYLYCRLRRIPLVGGVHIGRPLEQKYGRLLARLLRLGLRPYLRYCALFFYLNEGGRRNLRWLGVPEERTVRHMYGTWGVDLAEYAPQRDGREPNWGSGPVLLFVGRLHQEKGIAHLYAAYERVRAQVPGVRLVLIGEGPERAAVERWAKERGWERDVLFLGAVKNRDLPPCYRAATLFVSPAVSTRKWEEYVGVTNLQAMACGVPVVSTRSGAIPEYVPETAGILVPERDAEALAAAIARLLDDPELRQRMGQAGRQHCSEHCDARRNVMRAEELLLGVLRSAGHGPSASPLG